MAFLAGCAVERPPEVPANAIVATSGQDHLSYSVSSHGTIWVYDVNGNKILYSGKVDDGQVVVVDTTAHDITIDGRVVVNKDVDHGPTYRVFFQATDRD
jgi:hypothetical protein